jgi:hypothetical protein
LIYRDGLINSEGGKRQCSKGKRGRGRKNAKKQIHKARRGIRKILPFGLFAFDKHIRCL